MLKMDKPFPLKFELPSPARQLRVERIEDSHWKIWLTANGSFTLGTFLQLCDNGSINRTTWHEDGTETVFNIKEKNHD